MKILAERELKEKVSPIMKAARNDLEQKEEAPSPADAKKIEILLEKENLCLLQLGFGLIQTISEIDSASRAGTPAYMAPEQMHKGKD